MARYCFYCGRELTSGEKCDCRTTGSHSGGTSDTADRAGTDTATAGRKTTGPASKSKKAGSTKSQPKSSSEREPFFKRIFNPINPFASGQSGRSSSSRPKQQQRPQKARPAAQPRQPITARNVLLELQQFVTYLTHPADSVRSALQKTSRRFVLIILVLQGLCGGLFLLVAASRPMVRALLSLSNATASGSVNFANGIFLFIQGFGVAVVATLMLALLYLLTLKYLYRHPVPFQDLLAVLSPATLYFTVFLLAALLTLSSSVFSALMLVVAGFAVAAIAQYLAMREVAGTDDNRSFVLVTFVMLIYTSVLSLMLNLSLPMLLALLETSTVF